MSTLQREVVTEIQNVCIVVIGYRNWLGRTSVLCSVMPGRFYLLVN